MNRHDEKHLETAVDRELKALPSLRAPQTLLPRVMAAIEQRAVLPWYRRAWQTWPLPLQTVSMTALLAAFAGVCLGTWQLVHTPAVVSATSEVGGWLSLLGTVWNTAGVLLNALTLAVKSLGTWVVVGCVVALLTGYAACVGLGTVYVRFALARR